MSVFSFLTASQIRFGRGSATAALDDIAALGARILLVHGATGGRAVWLREGLLQRGCAVAGFACAAEPDVPLIEAGLRAARDMGAEAVVSLGGGSVIDAGKAIAALAPATRAMMDHLEVVGRGLPLEQPPLPFAALPSTAGTGAEVTKNAVIGVPEARRKVSLRDVRMLPDLAVVDPALTDRTPWAVTLASGLDAVTQVIEPYLSCKANRMSDALSRDAIPLGLAALVRLAEGEDPTARDDLAWTSLCGGLSLANSGLGAVHGLAGVLGGVTGAAHGAICGVLLPHVLAANAGHPDLPDATRARCVEVAGWIGAALDVPPERAFGALAEWSRNKGLPALSLEGLADNQVSEIAEAARGSSSMKGNPVSLSQETLVSVMRAADRA